MSKLEELEAKEEAAWEAFKEARDILAKTPEEAAWKAWLEKLGVAKRTPEGAAVYKAWDVWGAAREKLREAQDEQD